MNMKHVLIVGLMVLFVAIALYEPPKIAVGCVLLAFANGVLFW